MTKIAAGLLRMIHGHRHRPNPGLHKVTPGRVLDLLDSKSLNFRRATQVVLDEADQMLDGNFLRQV